MKEVWKQFRDTVYFACEDGRIMNNSTGNVLATTTTRQGYKRLTIWHKGATFTIMAHRVVAECHLGPPPFDNAVVNHKDGSRSNNCKQNLEWTTISQNVQHAYDTGLSARGEDCTVAVLTETQVIKIKSLFAEHTIRSIAKMYGVSDAAISHIRNGDTWTHVGCTHALPDKEKYHKYKLSAEDIPVIRQLFVDGKSDNHIAALYGIHRASIHNIRAGKNWKNY